MRFFSCVTTLPSPWLLSVHSRVLVVIFEGFLKKIKFPPLCDTKVKRIPLAKWRVFNKCECEKGGGGGSDISEESNLLTKNILLSKLVSSEVQLASC